MLGNCGRYLWRPGALFRVTLELVPNLARFARCTAWWAVKEAIQVSSLRIWPAFCFSRSTKGIAN